MVNIDDVKAFIESDHYQAMLLAVQEQLNLDINESQPSDILFQHDANKINIAKVDIDALEQLLEHRKVGLVPFVRAKLSTLMSTAHEQEGNQDEDKIVKTLPFYKNFLIIYLLELFFLENAPEQLDAYLKGIRIPNSKKYKEQLVKIHAALDH
ncbi:hypothetical protein IFR35_01095 [Pseudomonas fluorescens]|uniref:hypothetical protein n=1 Tax=Pseudomonas TaxID=286 RepID=UPI000C1616BC|nr:MULTISPECIES: hypothetical protein [Pseudomonas]KAE9649916.1 hypothetical protein EJD88_25320 [Pseudomonas sp. PB105]MBD8191057.1 hypothetical protein [Pseudomonas fluorescens]MBD8225956.1 hypothetical protein [Pseudomonas fluorescens]MBD8236307.1 hypothetical protein [Pseudomonas fluorescens]MBD8782806.1 hypothetical protein [Pseudomonas fluorescens]